ncbi:MAG TPA: MFS transporter, partial [Stellaceae bacterium]|nr:MFS transporter [Stellaceae bacterium]
YPTARRSRVTALFMLGIPLASVIGGPMSGAIMTVLQGVGHLAGWQWLFVIEAFPAIILGFCIYGAVPASPATARWLTPQEREMIAARKDDDPPGPDAHRLTHALANPLIWLVGVIDAALLLGLYSVAFWLPTFIRNTGVVDPFTIGCLVAIPHLVAMAAMLVVGRHSDRQRERRWHVAVPMLVGAAALALSPLASGSLVPTVVLFSIANAAILSAIPPLWCVPGTFLRGAGAAAGLALAGSLANLAGFFSTSLVGWLLDVAHSANIALLAFALCLIIGAGLALAMPSKVVNR